MAVQKMYEVFILARRTTADLSNVDTTLKNPVLQDSKVYAVTVGLNIDGSCPKKPDEVSTTMKVTHTIECTNLLASL